MNYELFKKLNDIDQKKIANFFDSYYIEPEYFNCQKENLISVENYLMILKNMKYEYDKQTKEVMSSIKEKKQDIIKIEPYFNENTNNDLIIFEQDKLVIFPQYTHYEYMEKELKELMDIISKSNYLKEREGFISASNNFVINPLCFSLIQVLLKDKSLLAELELQDSDYEVKKIDTKYIKRYTKDNIKRIYFSK